jgi:hypothetical protein
MLENYRRKTLQRIIDDASSTPLERAEAQRAILDDQSGPRPPRRFGRNAKIPQSQADQDADIENHFRNLRDDRLDSEARREIEDSLPESTKAILDAYFSEMMAIYTRHDTESPLLIDLAKRTQSDFVRAKTLQAIRAIAGCSESAAKRQAKDFLQTQNATQENE